MKKKNQQSKIYHIASYFNEKLERELSTIQKKEERAIKDFYLLEAFVESIIERLDLISQQTKDRCAFGYQISFITDFDMDTSLLIEAVVDVLYDKDRLGRCSRTERLVIQKTSDHYYLEVKRHDLYAQNKGWPVAQDRKRSSKKEIISYLDALIVRVSEKTLSDIVEREKRSANDRLYAVKRALNLKH